MFGVRCPQWLAFVLGGAVMAAVLSDRQPLAEARFADVPTEANFAWKHIVLNNNETMEAVLYNTKTGESWRRDGVKWTKHTEAAPPPPGKYDLLMAPSTGTTFWLFRLDQMSGKSWYIDGTQKWNPVERATP
jgi:hypothetical protein